MMDDFHFIRPLFLWLIPLGVALVFWLANKRLIRSDWARYFDADKLRVLSTSGSTTRRWIYAISAFAWLVGCLALAGPTLEKRATPTLRNQQPLVILFDQSPSMMAGDVSPNRLIRARLKLIDLLRERSDGATALIAYAGDPHVVAPLTEDANTIEALLPALSPAVMPIPGSNTEAAFALALDLLSGTGQLQGDVLLITDGVEPAAQRRLLDLRPANVSLSILGVGTQDGAPIPSASGFVRDARDQIVVAMLNRGELESLANAMTGRYVDLQADDSDIQFLLDGFAQAGQGDQFDLNTSYDEWHDLGYWLVLLLLPFGLYAWRRGLVVCVALVLLPVLPKQSHALSWQDLWLSPDQQGMRELRSDNFERAAEQFKSSSWRGYAEFRQGDHAAAAESFASSVEQNESVVDQYNFGTALAHQGELQQAIAAYDQVLEQDPAHEDARYNRNKIQEFLDRQQQNQNQQGESSDQSEPSENQSTQNNQGDSSGQNESDQNQSNNQNSSSEQADSGTDQSDQQQQSANNDSATNPNESEQNPSTIDEAEQEEKGNETTQATADEPDNSQSMEEQMTAAAEPQTEEDPLSPASEQWLRAIPDDPDGLLRRKFEYQSELYRRQQRFTPSVPGSELERRY